MFKRVALAFQQPEELSNDGPEIPRYSGLDREKLATASIDILLKRYKLEHPPVFLIDCHSTAALSGPAPSYRLAMLSGLSKVMPFSLDNQGGTEIFMGLLFSDQMLIQEQYGILVATQCVVSPDTRFLRQRYPLSDASAAILISKSLHLIQGISFRVLGVNILQLSVEKQGCDEQVMNGVINLLEDAGVKGCDVKWGISQFKLDDLAILPSIKLINRPNYRDCDFGTPDALLTLEAISQTPPATSSVGMIVVIGKFGSVGMMLLQMEQTLSN